VNGDRVAIVGGGPAGSFFAVHLLREARRLGLSIEVVIVEKRPPTGPECEGYQCRGCNYCAGIISPRLNEVLEKDGLAIPKEIIQGQIDHVWIHGQWKNFRLRVPKEQRMYSVYRGSLPGRRQGRPMGFDGFLLGEAVKEGAQILFGKAQRLAYDPSGKPVLTIQSNSGEDLSLGASFVCFAAGINAQYGAENRPDTLFESIRQLNPAFVPGRTRRALIFELEVGEEFIERNLNREVYFIEYGAKHLALEHTALIPKGRFLTVAMIGRCVDEAVLPQDSRRLAREFLTLPQVDRILPRVAEAPLSCVCAPRMPVTTAASPFGDRFAIIGDAVGARLNKDGLYSAHTTASSLAQTVLHEGIDRRALERGYGETIRWLVEDNRCGQIVFAASRTAFATPFISRIAYQAVATEYKVRKAGNRPLSGMLWKIASGTADYREVLREMVSWGVLVSTFAGAAVTLRNMAVEAVLGMNWGEYGRYPAVVPVERLQTLKQEIFSSLGLVPNGSPGFERMYAIKIRGTETEIMEQLAKYGQPDARFLKVRFLHTGQIKGTPNQVGSIILYRIPLLRFSEKLLLTRRVDSEALLYEAEERLVDRGKLIFQIAPTFDGNRRLSIYGAFDYKTGKSLASRFMWKAMRLLFPGFVHDVVWNHALCTIKEEVERKHSQAGENAPGSLVSGILKG
jgi:flavin-dependent dehydrogenase